MWKLFRKLENLVFKRSRALSIALVPALFFVVMSTLQINELNLTNSCQSTYSKCKYNQLSSFYAIQNEKKNNKIENENTCHCVVTISTDTLHSSKFVIIARSSSALELILLSAIIKL